MSLQINDNNYAQYKKIYEIIWTHYSKLLPAELVVSPTPIEILNSWEKKSKTLAKRGLKEGLRDMIFQSEDFPANLLTNINTDLVKNELPEINSLKNAIRDTIGKVLKRQRIKSLEEFYVIKEYVVDFTNDLSENTRQILDKYMTEFEFSKTKQ